MDSFSGIKLDGATFLLGDSIPVIGMSLRYNRLDYYWFTLFHELSHVILHQEHLKTPLLDDLEKEKTTDIENEANNLALKMIIPRSVWRSCDLNYNADNKNVYKLAEELKIHPALVAGRYRKERNNYSIFSDIVNAINIKDFL